MKTDLIRLIQNHHGENMLRALLTKIRPPISPERRRTWLVFVGTPVQSGHGLGGLISGLLRKVIPLAGKVILPLVKKHEVPVVKNVAKNILSAGARGRTPKQALKTGPSVGKADISMLIRAEEANALMNRASTSGVSRKRTRRVTGFEDALGGL